MEGQKRFYLKEGTFPTLDSKEPLLWNLTFTSLLSENHFLLPFLFPPRSLIFKAPHPGSLPQGPQSILDLPLLGLLLLSPWVLTASTA